MKKLWQNNFFKLPVFLLVIGIICGTALSLINTLTVPVIEHNAYVKKIQAYNQSFEDVEGASNLTVSPLDLNSSLNELGITDKVSVSFDLNGDKKVGYVYAGEVQGYAAKISFTVSFLDNKYHNFIVISEGETNKKGISYISANLKDYDLSNPNFFTTDSYATGVSGASMTGKKGLIDTLNACASDYQSTIA